MALNYNGVGLRCTTIFPDCVEQTIKFFKESVDREARTPCRWLRAFWRHRHRIAFRQLAHKLNGDVSARAWESIYSLGGFCVGRQTLTSVHLLFRYFVRAFLSSCKRTMQRTCRRCEPLHDQRSRRSGTYERPCRSSRRWSHSRTHRRVGKPDSHRPRCFRDPCKDDTSTDTQGWRVVRTWSLRLLVWVFLVVFSFL